MAADEAADTHAPVLTKPQPSCEVMHGIRHALDTGIHVTLSGCNAKDLGCLDTDLQRHLCLTFAMLMQMSTVA